MRSAIFCLALLVTSGITQGCASRTVVTSSAPLWPFEQLEVRTARIGSVIGYLSLPESEPRQLVVVIQAPWCPLAGQDRAPSPSISTSGVIREQFRSDAAFLQFERPAIRSSSSSAVSLVKCADDDRFDAAMWTSTLIDVIDVIAKHKKLNDLPFVVIGVGTGAAPALQLALRDSRVVAVATLNADWDTIDTSGIKLPRTRMVILETDEPRRSLEFTQHWVDRVRHHQRATLIVIRGAGEDLGLKSDAVQCFERVAALLAEQLRDAAEPDGAMLHWNCAGDLESDRPNMK